MDWKKIYLEIQSRGCHEDFHQDLIDAFLEYDRQHLEECHGGFIVRMEAPYRCPTDNSEPQTRLSGTMESDPEAKCHGKNDKGCPFCCSVGGLQTINSFNWNFCPICGKAVIMKEE